MTCAIPSRRYSSSKAKAPCIVKEQMGHSSIQVTVDLYGHLIPGGNKQAVDRLDTQVLESAKREKFCVPVVTRSEQSRFFGPPPSSSSNAGKNEWLSEQTATQPPPELEWRGA